jgi:hypothetical protein
LEEHITSTSSIEEQAVPPKHQMTFTWLDGIISQKVELVIVTATRT